MADSRRTCPCCEQAILPHARVCPHCRSELQAGHEPAQSRRARLPTAAGALAAMAVFTWIGFQISNLAPVAPGNAQGPTPAVAQPKEPAPPPRQRADPSAPFDLARPVYLAKDAVMCPELTVMAAYLDGHHAGGEAAGHQAVANLFVNADGHDCIRTLERERVRVLDPAVTAAKLVEIHWDGFTSSWGKFEARPQDLSN